MSAIGHSRCLAGSQKSKAAFTLAEVLITLAVIGVVAVLTIPGLIKNHNEKAWGTAQSVFVNRLEVAAKQMNTEEKLTGYSSTMDFVNELKKYIKITKVCESNDLSKCFASKVLTADGEEIDAANLKTSSQLAKENWGTETVGVQFADGVSALIAYNPNTDQQPFNNQFSATAASMAILYDVSGYKNPNTLGKDVNQNANVKTIGCMIEPDLLGGMCITKCMRSYDAGYLTKAECEEAINEGVLGITRCGESNYDYWAAAVKACGGVNKLPSREQLLTLAQYFYNTPNIKSTGRTENLILDTDKFKKFSPSLSYMYIWSKEDYADGAAYHWDYEPTHTYYAGCNKTFGNVHVICVK